MARRGQEVEEFEEGGWRVGLRKGSSAWPHVFSGRASCLFCGSEERTVVVPSPEATVGLCEACSVASHLTWREEGGDAVFETPNKVTHVKVVACRLGKEDGELALVPTSYQFAVVEGPDGSIDLPTSKSLDGDVVKAAVAALGGTGLVTWTAFVERLYAGYTPRGARVVVVLLGAWAESRGSKVRWVGLDQASSAVSFYEAFVGRLWKHKSVGRTTSLSVQLREAAAKYVDIVLARQEGEKVDESMVPYLKASMSDDEKLVVESLRDLGRLEDDLHEQQAEEGGGDAQQSEEGGGDAVDPDLSTEDDDPYPLEGDR